MTNNLIPAEKTTPTKDLFTEIWAPVLNSIPTKVESFPGTVLSALLRAELADVPKFSEEEALGLLAVYQVEGPVVFYTGRQLASDLYDNQDVFQPSRELLTKLEGLSITQDWAIRVILALHEERPRQGHDVTLRKLGFPLN